MPTLIIAALLSITGLLGAFLYIGQSKDTGASIVAQQAEQRCSQARFDARFDGALTLRAASSPQAKIDAARVAQVCAEAEQAKAHATAVVHEQSGVIDRLENAIGHALKGD
jgi:uncharacterized protein YqfA (UPF0365 family)